MIQNSEAQETALAKLHRGQEECEACMEENIKQPAVIQAG